MITAKKTMEGFEKTIVLKHIAQYIDFTFDYMAHKIKIEML